MQKGTQKQFCQEFNEFNKDSIENLQLQLQKSEQKVKKLMMVQMKTHIQFYFIQNLHCFNSDIKMNLFEMASPLLAILKPHEKSRMHASLLNCFTALSDNQMNNEGGKYMCKFFLSNSKVDPIQYDKYLVIKNQLEPQWIALYSEHNFQVHYIFKQITDIIKMQNDAIITNALFSESSPNDKYNYAFVALNFYIKYEICRLGILFIYLKANGKQFKQKILFLNFCGKENQDYEVHEKFKQQNYLYIALQQQPDTKKELQPDTKKYKNDKHFRIIPIQGKIQWKQFKILFRTYMKRDIEIFNPSICILSLGKCFENQVLLINRQDYLSLEDEFLHKLVKKIAKISKDRLIIHTQIQKHQSAQPNEMQVEEEQNQIELAQHSSLFHFLNAIFQGIIQSFCFPPKDKDHLKWMTEQKETHLNTMNHQQLEIFSREMKNKQVTTQKKIESSFPGTPIIILPEDFFYLKCSNKTITLTENSLLNIDYKQQLVCFLDCSDYILYIGQWNQQTKYTIECKSIDLKQDLEGQNQFSMVIQNSQILIFPLKNKNILAVNLQNTTILYLERFQSTVDQQKKGWKNKVHYKLDEIDKISEGRVRPGIVNTAIDSNFDFMVIGGEFSNKPQVCNIIELIKIHPENKFSSIILKKDLLLEKNNFKPFPHMLILVNDHQPFTFVFLPGDYDNKEMKYQSAINQEHYKYAMVLIVVADSYKYSWERYEIYYEKNNQGIKPVPITEFTHKQNNVKYIGGLKWLIGLTKLEPKRFGQCSNSQKIFFPNEYQFCSQSECENQKEGNFCVMAHQIELELTSRNDAGKTIKSLIIKQKSFQIGSVMKLTQSSLQPSP